METAQWTLQGYQSRGITLPKKIDPFTRDEHVKPSSLDRCKSCLRPSGACRPAATARQSSTARKRFQGRVNTGDHAHRPGAGWLGVRIASAIGIDAADGLVKTGGYVSDPAALLVRADPLASRPIGIGS